MAANGGIFKMKRILTITIFYLLSISMTWGQSAQDIIDAMIPTPDTERQELIDSVYTYLNDKGLLAEFDAFGFTAAHSEQAGLLWWNEPDSSCVNFGATFTTDRGFEGDFSSAYINTGFNVKTESVNFTQDNSSMGLYTRRIGASARWDMGYSANSDSTSVITSRRTLDRFYMDPTSAFSSLKYLPNDDGRGFFVATRINSVTIYGSINGGTPVARTQGSRGLPDLDMYLLARNTDGVADSYSDNEIAFWFIGAYLNTTQISDLNDIVVYYMKEVGAYLDDTYADAQEAGAAADGVTDDWPVLQSLLDSTELVYITIGHDTNDVFLISQPLIHTNNRDTITINGKIIIKDQTLSTIVQDITEGDSTFVSDDASVYNVGEWIAVTDTSQYEIYATDRGWAGRIDSIDVDTIWLDNQSPLNIWVDSLPRVGHIQSCLILDNADSCLITGSGIIDNNRANQSDDIHPTYTTSEMENQRAGIGLCNWEGDHNTFENITVRNGAMHSMAVTSMNTNDTCNNIVIRNMYILNGHDKCLLMRFTTDADIDTLYCEGADWEEGIAFYNNNYNATVDSVRLINNGRFGLLWGGNYSDSIIINEIYTEGNYRYGIGLYGNNATITDAQIDGVFMYDVYNNCDDHTLNNILIDNKDVSTFPALKMQGGIDNIRINNLTVNNCFDGTGIYAGELFGQYPNDVIINRTGIFNHTNGADVEIINPSDVTFINFSYSGSARKLGKYNKKRIIYNNKYLYYKP